MITKNFKDIIAIAKDSHTITAVYRGARLVWQSIRSCFGSGFWVNEKPWLNDEAWKN